MRQHRNPDVDDRFKINAACRFSAGLRVSCACGTQLLRSCATPDFFNPGGIPSGGSLTYAAGELIWVEGQRKTSLLFLQLLWKLTQHYAQARVIHVVLDNYSIHSTQQVALSLDTEQGRRLRLHFLPPYCPDHNRIERAWEDLHANVTRNHTCREMPRLMRRVRGYLRRRNNRRRDATAA